MISVVAGPNSYRVKRRANEITSKFIEEYGEVAVEKLDAEEGDVNRIISAAESTPFLSSKKLVVIHGLSSAKQATDDLDRLISRIADTTELLIIEPKPDKRSAYYKKLQKLDGFEEFIELEEPALTDWIVQEAKNQDAQININDARYLIDRTGKNQDKLLNELIKLTNFDKKITRENIDELVESVPQSSIFNLLDAAFAGNPEKTLKLYDEQRSQGIEPLNILGMIVWQMHAVAIVAASKDTNPKTIASASGLKPFVIQKSMSILRRLEKNRVSTILEKMVELDKSLKTAPVDPDTALKNFLVTITGKQTLIS